MSTTSPQAVCDLTVEIIEGPVYTNGLARYTGIVCGSKVHAVVGVGHVETEEALQQRAIDQIRSFAETYLTDSDPLQKAC